MRMTAASRLTTSTRSFFFVAAAFSIIMIGATLPTSIYRFYEQRYAFPPTTITVIFACYALGALAALLIAGNWSDQLGRRSMLLWGLVASAASGVEFLVADGLPALMLGRVLSGISAGIFTGTATVAVIEQAPQKWQRQATFAATASNVLGLGLGPVLSGVLVDLCPWPTRLSFAVHLALVVLGMFFIIRAPETAKLPDRAHLRMQCISLPPEVRTIFVPAALAGFSGFVVLGFFTAVSPQLARTLLGFKSGAAIGGTIFLFFVFSALGQAAPAHIPFRVRLAIGCGGLILGLVCMAACVQWTSPFLLFMGVILAGMGQGVSFRASLSELASKSPLQQRAGVISSFFVVLFVALSIPVIAVGFVIQHEGIRLATLLFAWLTTAVVVVALAMLLRREGEQPSRGIV
ncbi:major facilitator superfamily (MFS) multidrug efflux pump (plasmid) [Caballeronia insecticola]|uniref:Major facilitator superfamily (MFS) multidrug efflux pump n=2 Tax=Caballeronia insecticola TaxID=758793 RepID=A0A060PRA0_9BURK|nr:major facilitator superfamily (MFS) multidrug efflux pump [Caballeronia insecticola]